MFEMSSVCVKTTWLAVFSVIRQ